METIPCLTCGRPADSKEHYIPQWLSKATGRPNEVIIKGALVEGVVQSAKEHGTAIQAFEENLCHHCNHTLGNTLESPVSGMLKPMMAGNFSVVPSLKDGQRQLIAWWAVLHALEHDFLENRLDPAPKRELLGLLGALIAGKQPSLPVDVHVHLAKSVHPEVGFFLSKQLIDQTRGSVQANGSFCWGMQAELLILSVSRMPSGARPVKGWGFGVWPPATAKVPTYDDIRFYRAASQIETGLPVPGPSGPGAAVP